jgi:hypothetical protein
VVFSGLEEDQDNLVFSDADKSRRVAMMIAATPAKLIPEPEPRRVFILARQKAPGFSRLRRPVCIRHG